MKAKDVMTSDHIWAVAEEYDCRHVAQMMAEHNVGSVPVLDGEGRLAGIVTDRDLCVRIVARGRSFEIPVHEVMTTRAMAVSPDTDLHAVEEIMRAHRVRRLPVVDADRKLLGFISLADLARHTGSDISEHDLLELAEAIFEPRKSGP